MKYLFYSIFLYLLLFRQQEYLHLLCKFQMSNYRGSRDDEQMMAWWRTDGRNPKKYLLLNDKSILYALKYTMFNVLKSMRGSPTG